MLSKMSLIDIRFWLQRDQVFRSLKVPLDAKVSDVKLLLCNGKNMSPEECEVIFCGHVMKDTEQLHCYDLGLETVLHVVKRHTEPTKKVELCSPIHGGNKNSYLTGIWMHRQHTGTCFHFVPLIAQPENNTLTSKYPKFYVYCKHGCKEVQAGKLRVRCASCKEDSVILHRDPQDWNDVLQSGQILATCRSPKCDCDVCDAEFYFKCGTCQNINVETPYSESSVPFSNVTTNINSILCSTCFDVCDPVITFPCDNEHVMCLQCFEQYARNKLRERQLVIDKHIGYTVRCPNGCRDSFMSDTHLFHILGIDEYGTYQAFAAEECLIREMKGMVCPNPNCGAGIFPDLALDFESKTRIDCPSCGDSFCSTCRENYHGNSNCDTVYVPRPGSSATVRDYLASVNKMKEISKKCPNCQVPTERSGGCMHMTCRMCEYEWCWSCLTQWSRDCQANHWFN